MMSALILVATGLPVRESAVELMVVKTTHGVLRVTRISLPQLEAQPGCAPP